MAKSKYRAIKVNGVKQDYHRYLMEQKLGRKLDSNEVVHHMDDNKSNNDIDNLQVMTRSEHAKLHAKPPYFPEWVYDDLRVRMTGNIPKNRKLTEDDVRFIRAHYVPRDPEYGARALGRKYGVRHQTIYEVAKGERYKNV